MAIQIRKAQRRKAKLRLALLGPTGSGKTYSALQLGFGIGGKIGVIDTENGSADLYADLGDYDVITLEKPYTVHKYREAISAFEQASYDVIIIDSLSHAWAGSGGLLDKQGQTEKKVGNSFAAWREITPEHNSLVEALLTSPAHIIATMRVKTEYVLEQNERGKMVPVKKGMQPVQRDSIEYEFTVVMDVDADHKASSSKDRTKLFDGWYDRITPDTGRRLRDWLEAGDDAPVVQLAPPSPWGIVSRDGSVKTLPSAEAYLSEWRMRIAAVDRAIKLDDAGKRATLQQMHEVNLAAFERLDEAGHDAITTDVIRMIVEAVARHTTAPEPTHETEEAA